MSLRFSVALCTYNGARYLVDQLDSFISQVRRPDELIICDDGSTDESLNIIMSFAEHAPFPVRIYRNEQNLGFTKNFEKAIQLCDGDIIALADQDDVWYPDKLQTIESIFLSSPDTGLVFTDAKVVNEKLHPLGYTLWEAIDFSIRERKLVRQGKMFDVLIRHNVVTGATMAFQSKLRRIILPIQDGWIHDAWIGLVVSIVGQVSMVEQPLISYRQHDNNQIGAPRLSLFNRIQCAGNAPLGQYLIEWNQLLETRKRVLGFGYDQVGKEVINKIDNKLLHLFVRGHLPKRKRSRLVQVLRELVKFNYHHYSKGFNSFAADLFLHS